nr:hypothetical protein B11C_110364 [Bartonella sp. 1-1C]
MLRSSQYILVRYIILALWMKYKNCMLIYVAGIQVINRVFILNSN